MRLRRLSRQDYAEQAATLLPRLRRLYGLADAVLHVSAADQREERKTFSSLRHVRWLLLRTPLWALLCALQPVNSLVFVYDGLLFATQSFAYARNALAIGAIGVFAPGLAAAKLLLHRGTQPSSPFHFTSAYVPDDVPPPRRRSLTELNI